MINGSKKSKKLASAIVLQAREECRKRKIDPYIAVGAFIDETIRELSKVNSDEKVAEFLVSISEKVRLGMYKKKKST